MRCWWPYFPPATSAACESGHFFFHPRNEKVFFVCSPASLFVQQFALEPLLPGRDSVTRKMLPLLPCFHPRLSRKKKNKKHPDISAGGEVTSGRREPNKNPKNKSPQQDQCSDFIYLYVVMRSSLPNKMYSYSLLHTTYVVRIEVPQIDE